MCIIVYKYTGIIVYKYSCFYLDVLRLNFDLPLGGICGIIGGWKDRRSGEVKRMYQIGYFDSTGKYGWATFCGSYWELEVEMTRLKKLGYTQVAAMKL
jgi:hypothetical protein